MKNFFSAIIGLCCVLFAAHAEGSVANGVISSPLDHIQIPSDASRVVSLNGDWSFKFIDSPDWSGSADFYKNDFKYDSWDKIPVPGCWDALGYLTAVYAHPEDVNGLYRMEFNVPESWANDRVLLNFDGVLRAYDLWINGNYAGKWELANNSRQFDVTEFVKPGVNKLALRVYTRCKGYEFDGNDDWGQVGIHRNVTLFSVPQTHLKDLTIVTKVPEGKDAQLSFTMQMDGSGATLDGTELSGVVRSPEGKIVKKFKSRLTGERMDVKQEFELASAQLWTAETPSLYTLELSVRSKGKTVETVSRRFGVREIRIDGKRMFLNNRIFKLRGVNIHATDPRNGKVISDELSLKDLRMMKEANVNFIRMSHYPREPRFFELCDSLGFYVDDEVPFGYGDEHLEDASYQDNLNLRAEATVIRDKNHPCVIFWSVGNENNLTEICQVTGKYVQRLDPSRPICYPMIGSYFNRFDFKLPDFLDFFAPHYPTVNTLKSYAERSYKPLVATEYCHTLGQAFENHHEMWEVMQANDNLVGGAVWEWVDQGMPDRVTKYPGKFAWTDRVWLSETDVIKMEGNQGTDGLLYPTRDPLPNYFGMRKNYAQAYVLTESVKARPGRNTFVVYMENRYDFVDFADRVTCNWTVAAGKNVIASGVVNPSCAPHSRCNMVIEADLADMLAKTPCYLTLNFVDKTNGLAVNEKTFLLNDKESYSAVLGNLQAGLSANKKAADYIQGEPLWRTGRKQSIAEDLILTKKGGEYVLNYLMKGKLADGKVVYENSDIKYSGVVFRKDEGAVSSYNFSMTPSGDRKLVLEAGLALLLDPSLRYVQWIGEGPYTSYPGKNNANDSGVHALQAGDLYFEGNKMGVDALLCTDAEGNGVLFISDVKNVNFEETDKGLVISFNPVVSGMGRKGNITTHPQYSDQIGTLEGKVLAVPVQAGRWNEALDAVFNAPSSIGKYAPFISVYDTYLRKLDEVTGR